LATSVAAEATIEAGVPPTAPPMSRVRVSVLLVAVAMAWARKRIRLPTLSTPALMV